MIKTILNIFRQQAQEHKTIKAFYYNRNYELGSGNEAHPLFWLEDPVYGRNENNVFSNSVNFSILFLPTTEESISHLQNLAFSIGLNIIERIKKNPLSEISIRPDWTYTTLREYYDNNSCGCRFSINFTQVNMQNLCLIEEQFDVEKEFDDAEILKSFDVSATPNNDIFYQKLPDFDIKTRKQ
ncbi:hypothetical protein JGH11_14625 [Dysgonomonas sp. Marseille-P4677]|uniref:hypothetical protein n=1 Tax=Dysgonomonas sp. Marseille-P4677 TaxID=2364790 RepID=UPI0019134F09|nr:hypothetical protein [Dysgonomonas sp. Marseille-P4677]MBK5722110.1 hypothetical protein [Dysgonomonas sp. Marseille-P4677]